VSAWTHQAIADRVADCGQAAIDRFKKERDAETARLVEAREEAADAELPRLQTACGGIGHIFRFTSRGDGTRRCVVCLFEEKPCTSAT
jgi:hypothetical protein